ncbi:hypothetical protein T4B_12761 [Trichinella pseudospiralis]|uniref:Uncharacterized protein n=1 Tax=Trichinella pseudospiralis TaxID=6337 RepID=A0A0V1IM99_TRIPS|nr:hypothetical protein T4B_12761 [Trichinella pseudospiralis]
MKAKNEKKIKEKKKHQPIYQTKLKSSATAVCVQASQTERCSWRRIRRRARVQETQLIDDFVCNPIVKAYSYTFRPSSFSLLLSKCAWTDFVLAIKQDRPFLHTLCVVKKFTEKFQNTLHQQLSNYCCLQKEEQLKQKGRIETNDQASFPNQQSTIF